MDVTLVVLGSGQDGGSPQVGQLQGVGPVRSASSIAIAVEDGPLVLFDATPDIREQDQRVRLQGFGARSENPYDAVCITHAHMGHYTGLVHFGKEAAATRSMPLVAPGSVIDYFESNDPWKALIDDGRLEPMATESGPFNLGSLTVTGIEVPHRAEFSRTVGYSVAIEGAPWAFYVPDIDSWHEWNEAEDVLGKHAVCLVDATFGSPGELPGRDLSTIPHPFVDDTLRTFAHLADGCRMILTHMNHSNSVAEPSSDLAIAAARAGFEIAHDGLTIRWSA